MLINMDAMKVLVSETIDDNHSIRNLKQDVVAIKADIAQNNQRHNARFDYLDGMIESIQGDIRLILDALIPVKRREEQIIEIGTTVENHEVRICAVESVVKSRDY